MKLSRSQPLPEKTAQGLAWIIERLEREKIPYVIGGGLAAWFYGSRRAVRDIDVDVPLECIGPLVRKLARFIHKPLNFYRWPRMAYYGAILNYRGQEIDLGAAESYFRRQKTGLPWQAAPTWLSQRTWKSWHGRRLALIDRAQLIELKRYRNAPQDREDVRGMMQAAR